MATARKKKLTIVCDLGTSSNKILYCLGRTGAVKHLVTGSEYLNLGKTGSNNFVVTSGVGKPEDNCWLEYNNAIHLVGRLADENKAGVSIKSLKYEMVVPKVLAIIGAIAVKEKLKTGFSVKLAILLPYGEMNDQRAIEVELNKAVKDFKFQGQSYELELLGCDFIPEGYGILSHYLRSRTVEYIQSSTLIVLMFGYRNTSLLVFEEGTLNSKLTNSTDFGFYNLSDAIISKTSGLTRADILGAITTKKDRKIVQGKGVDYIKTYINSSELVKTTNASRAESERMAIASAIREAKSQYWLMITNWLNETLPPSKKVDDLIYTGGTSSIILEELTSYLQSKYSSVAVCGTDVIENELLRELGLKDKSLDKFKSSQLPVRFTDPWGYFRELAHYNLRVLPDAA